MDNEAFEDTPMSETGRILRKYASLIEHSGEPDQTLRDLNGNTVGEAKVTR
jgi:hypothetical protein